MAFGWFLFMNEASYITILATLIGSVISAASGIIISRHAARYAHQLAARKDSQEDTAQPSNAEIGMYARKIRRSRIALFLIDIVAFLIDSWFLWSLVSDASPLTRVDAFWITFYTLVTAYFGNRVLNDILGDTVFDQITFEARMDKLRYEKFDILVESQILLRKRVQELEAKNSSHAMIEKGKSQSEKRKMRRGETDK